MLESLNISTIFKSYFHVGYTSKIKFGASDNKEEITKTIVIRAGRAQLLISGV